MQASLPDSSAASTRTAILEHLLDGDLKPNAAAQEPSYAGPLAVVGELRGITQEGSPLLALPAAQLGKLVPGHSLVPVSADKIGRSALVVYAGCPAYPVLVGFLQTSSDLAPMNPPAEIEMDGERLIFNAQKEIVLRCGPASITLTQDGKVLINGEYLLSRAVGVQRIQGGSVQIN